MLLLVPQSWFEILEIKEMMSIYGMEKKDVNNRPTSEKFWCADSWLSVTNYPLGVNYC